MAFIDCTEQPIPRPKNKIRRKLYYSGKRNKHTVKNLYMVNNEEIILYKTRHKQTGKKHGYKIYKNNHHDTPKEVENTFDLGFLGVKEKDYPEQRSVLPIKRKKNQDLTLEEEKDYNKSNSKKRIVIEHAIGRLKKYMIMNDIFRNRLRKYDKVSDIVSGLVNYRIMNAM